MLDIGVSAYNVVPYVPGTVMGKTGQVREQLLTDWISRKNSPLSKDIKNIIALECK